MSPGCRNTESSQVATERIRFVKVPEESGLEIMLVEHSARLFRVFHESYDICVVPTVPNSPRSASYWQYRHQRRIAGPGCAMLTEPGEAHVTHRITAPATYWVALFEASLVAEAAADFGLASEPHLRDCQTTSAGLIRRMEALRTVCCRAASPLERQTRVALCLEALLKGHAESTRRRPAPAGHAKLSRARDYIHEHYAEPIRIRDLATVTGLSPSHLIRSFRHHYGMPPHRYQIGVRVSRARALLSAGCSAASAGVRVGFADQPHFTRSFKRWWGLTPGSYWRQIQGHPPVIEIEFSGGHA